jgi:hypothetical protein
MKDAVPGGTDVKFKVCLAKGQKLNPSSNYGSLRNIPDAGWGLATSLARCSFCSRQAIFHHFSSTITAIVGYMSG